MKDINTIERYLYGKMTDAEIQDFEKEIDSDSELSFEVELQRAKKKAIEMMNEESIRNKLKSLRAEVMAEEPSAAEKTNIHTLTPRKNNLLFLIPIAASIALLIGVFGYYNNQFSNDSLVKFSYQVESPDYGNVRKSVSVPDKQYFDPAIIGILSKTDISKMPKAVNYFKSFTDEKHPLFLKAKINLGHSYLHNKEYKKAEETFSYLQDTPLSDSRTKRSAQYYRAIALIGEGNDEEAKKQLDVIISNPAHPYQFLAKELYGKLNSFWRKI